MAIEVRLAGRASLASDDLELAAVVFGAGDWRTRTEGTRRPHRRSKPMAISLTSSG